MLPKTNTNRLFDKTQSVLPIDSEKVSIESYLNRRNQFQDYACEIWSANERFCIYPNGFYINRDVEAASFLKRTVVEATRRDTLALFLSKHKLYRMFSTRFLNIPRPTNVVDQNEQVQALKLINESLIIWTDRTVYKLPVSDKALKRMQQTQLKAAVLETLEPRKRSFYLIPQFAGSGNDLIQHSKKCLPIALDSALIQTLDDFLFSYFSLTLTDNSSSGMLPKGLQHGDLHFRNIFLDESNKLLIADIDLLSVDGYPFLDLIHFTVHLIRTKEQTKQHAPFERLIKDRHYLYCQLINYGFKKLSALWARYYSDAFLRLYIEDRREWYRLNQVVGDELVQLEQIEQEYRICF